MLLDVHVSPNARQDQIVGLAGGVLRVRVAAPPRDGRANDALVRLLAQALASLRLEGYQHNRNNPW